MPSQIIVYGTPSCPFVRPVRRILDDATVPYVYIDITQDEAGRQQVKTINNGNESVPTLVFPDGSSLTEPNPNHLQQKLATLGYELNRSSAWRQYILSNPSNWFIFLGILLAILLTILRFLRVL